jgi:4-hydroxyacetophenone monooxygenase
MLAERAWFDLAFSDAHLPCLIVAVAHMTGRMDLLRDEWRPSYPPYSETQAGNLPATEQVNVANALRDLVPKLIGRPLSDFPRPDSQSLKQLMHFVAGQRIPDRYIPLLLEELGLNQHSDESTFAGPPTARDFKVLVIGAGMSGILAGVKLKQTGYSYQIIERNDDIGGTWHANNYPGCRVDTQNHLYGYSFHPNYDWPDHFSTQDALKDYFRDIVDHYGLRNNIQLRTSFEVAHYDESAGVWRARLVGADGKSEEVTANAIISAVGQLNRPKIPPIAGQEFFKGAQMHSAAWRNDVELAGKDVAVVGTGASAFQVIPAIAGVARRLTVFQRTAPWVAPTPDYHRAVGEGQKWLLKSLPFYANWYRFWLFWTMTEGTMPTLRHDPNWRAKDGSISAPNQRIRNALIEKMQDQVGERTDLLQKIIPKSPFGGKRTLRDDGLWIATLKRDNVELVTEKIREITPWSVVTADGTERRAEVIIYGTGFEASRFLEPARIFGRGGEELTALWAGDPRAYLGITVPGFPNFFCIYGPNTNLVAQGSIVFISECAVHYIMGALELLRERRAAALEPRPEITDAYNARVDEENAKMAWGMPGVTNWYKSASGRVSQNWPFPLADYWQVTRRPDPADFIFTEAELPAVGAKDL